MKDAKTWIDFFIHVSKSLHTVRKIDNCSDVDKWADEVHESFKAQDAIDTKLKEETHDLEWFLD